MHTYSMRECCRERYIFYIALLSLAILGAIRVTVDHMGLVISVTAFSVFATIFFVFDRWIWRYSWFGKLLSTPDLSGDWTVSGVTDGADGLQRKWVGQLRIEQTWSHMSISIETDESRSRSTMASLERDSGHGFRLLYGYSNTRKGVQGELKSHVGTCEVIIAPDLQSAEATYFNNHQRRTVGEMKWARVKQRSKGDV